MPEEMDGIVAEAGAESMVREGMVTWLLSNTEQSRETAIGQLLMWEKGEGEMTQEQQDNLPGLANAWNTLKPKAVEAPVEVVTEVKPE